MRSWREVIDQNDKKWRDTKFIILQTSIVAQKYADVNS